MRSCVCVCVCVRVCCPKMCAHILATPLYPATTRVRALQKQTQSRQRIQEGAVVVCVHQLLYVACVGVGASLKHAKQQNKHTAKTTTTEQQQQQTTTNNNKQQQTTTNNSKQQQTTTNNNNNKQQQTTTTTNNNNNGPPTNNNSNSSGVPINASRQTISTRNRRHERLPTLSLRFVSGGGRVSCVCVCVCVCGVVCVCACACVAEASSSLDCVFSVRREKGGAYCVRLRVRVCMYA